jgi:hypothetical protein
MQKIHDLQTLLDSIHGCKIILNHNGLKFELTEAAFIAGLDMSRKVFDLELYYVYSGETKIAVINRIYYAEQFFVCINKPVIQMKKKWWLAAASFLP